MPPEAGAHRLTDRIADTGDQVADHGSGPKEQIGSDPPQQGRQIGHDDVMGAVRGIFFPGDAFVEQVTVAADQCIQDDQGRHSAKETYPGQSPAPANQRSATEDQEMKDLAGIAGLPATMALQRAGKVERAKRPQQRRRSPAEQHGRSGNIVGNKSRQRVHQPPKSNLFVAKADRMMHTIAERFVFRSPAATQRIML